MTWRERQKKIEDTLDAIIDSFSAQTGANSVKEASSTWRERAITVAALTEAALAVREVSERERDIEPPAEKLYKLRGAMLEMMAQLPDTVIGQSNNAIYNLKPLRQKISELNEVDL